jgi:copper(I)-binding protein
VAGRAELHLHAAKNDIMTMENITCLTVPAGGEVEFAPGGLHVMLLGLASPLKEGDMFSLHLTFDNAGVVAVDVPVKEVAAGSAHSHAMPSLRFCD